MIVHTCNPGTREVKARLRVQGQPRLQEQAQGQTRLYIETASKQTKFSSTQPHFPFVDIIY
jgi:hypothetical protein